jgi:hypothetical protein
MARLRADFWVAAHLRRCAVEGIDAYLRRRGAAEAGAIYIKVDRLDGTASLYGPAPQSLVEDRASDRLFVPVLVDVPPLEIEERLKREARFDPDCWLIELEDRAGRHFLPLAAED